MHEITTLTEQRDDLDMRELEAMEEETTLEGELAANLADEPALRAEVQAASEALAAAVADIDAQLEALEGQRNAAVSVVPGRHDDPLRPGPPAARHRRVATRRQAVHRLPPRPVCGRDRHRQGRCCRDRRDRLPPVRPDPRPLTQVGCDGSVVDTAVRRVGTASRPGGRRVADRIARFAAAATPRGLAPASGPGRLRRPSRRDGLVGR